MHERCEVNLEYFVVEGVDLIDEGAVELSEQLFQTLGSDGQLFYLRPSLYLAHEYIYYRLIEGGRL